MSVDKPILKKGHNPIRIGTRGSPLALAQARIVLDLMANAHNMGHSDFEIIPIKTSGDRLVDQRLSDWGGKGLFTKELEEALIDHRIDLAVHSMKDVQNHLHDDLCLAAVLPRIDARDAFISLTYSGIESLPIGAFVGTSSLRRQAQVLAKRPDLTIIPFRGNVLTRLEKLKIPPVSASFLAMAGLKRLGMDRLIHKTAHPIEISDMLPAVGQAIIGIECRKDDLALRDILQKINHAATKACLTAEREFLSVLDGSCRTPIAGHAQIIDNKLHFKGEILDPDGTNRHRVEKIGTIEGAHSLGHECGMMLKQS